MSVLAAQPVEFQRFSGWSDPRYPEGYWWGSVTGTGDGTGGSNNLAINFTQPAGSRSSKMFDLEQLAIHSGDTTALVGRLELANSEGPSNAGLRGILAVELQAFVDGSGLSGRDLTFLPLFLGSERSAALAFSLAFVIVNVDTEVVTLEAQGYWWGARSVLVPGGPQRPPTGLYGE